MKTLTDSDSKQVAFLVNGLARQYESVNSIAIKRHCEGLDSPKEAARAIKAGLEERGVIVRGKI